MSKEKREIFNGLFQPGERRDAAICIDHYIMEAAASVEDKDVAMVVLAAGVSIMGILKSLECGRSVEDVTAAIDDASKRAMAEVMLDMLDWAMSRGAVPVQ